MKFSTLNPENGRWLVWEASAPARDPFAGGIAQHRAPTGQAMGGFFVPSQLALPLPPDARQVGEEDLPVGVIACAPEAAPMGEVFGLEEETPFQKALGFARDVAVAVLAAKALHLLGGSRE